MDLKQDAARTVATTGTVHAYSGGRLVQFSGVVTKEGIPRWLQEQNGKAGERKPDTEALFLLIFIKKGLIFVKKCSFSFPREAVRPQLSTEPANVC
jgi:hypothetical protein